MYLLLEPAGSFPSSEHCHRSSNREQPKMEEGGGFVDCPPSLWAAAESDIWDVSLHCYPGYHAQLVAPGLCRLLTEGGQQGQEAGRGQRQATRSRGHLPLMAVKENLTFL
jgi:hypothetical protein